MQQGRIGKHACTGIWVCQEYFPVDVVTAGLMDIYQRLLGLKFKQVAGEVWHEDVQLWQVEDVATSENLGKMFRAFPQFCGSGIRCFFDPWIPGSGMGKIRIRDLNNHPGSYFRTFLQFCGSRIRFFYPLIRDGKIPDPGSGIRNSLVTIISVKNA